LKASLKARKQILLASPASTNLNQRKRKRKDPLPKPLQKKKKKIEEDIYEIYS
jgi:hypothetical protein